MKCIECQMEGFHKMDCSSKILMMDYEAFVSKIEQLPDSLLVDLVTRSSVEVNKRERYKKEYAESIPSLFDMYVRKGVEEAPEYCAANQDGECYHKGCPQTKNWQPICPIPDLEPE